MLGILLCLLVLLESILYAESNNESVLESYARNEIVLNKRVSDDKIRQIMELYDKAETDSFSLLGMIPHWDCAIPFTTEDGNEHKCKRNGDHFFCSLDQQHQFHISSWKKCIMKAAGLGILADPNKWKAPKECSKIFRMRKSNGNYYYYKGCTILKKGKPWCSHNIDYASGGQFSFCEEIIKKWTEWSDFSECTRTCNQGVQTRTRKCLKDGKYASGCVGNNKDSKTCFLESCDGKSVWLDWNSWTLCSASCGSGKRNRDRICYIGEGICLGKKEETENCIIEACSTSKSINETHQIIFYTIGGLLAFILISVLLAFLIKYKEEKDIYGSAS